jgi:hypothetical protein
MPSNFGKKHLLKQGDVNIRMRGHLTAMVWKGSQNGSLLNNKHHSPAEGSFFHESGNALKPGIVEDCNKHVGFVNKVD